MLSTQALLLIFIASFSVALVSCKKSEQPTSTSSAATQQVKVDPREKFNTMFTKKELHDIGEKVYQTNGMQTCLKCHRAGGEGEGYAGAAVLQKPWTWRSFNALGGYDALKADPKAFREKMETSLVYLLHGGGLNWNSNFAKDHPEITYDWSKTGKDKYDMMMWGVAQAEMKTKIKQVQDELAAAGKNIDEKEMNWLAAYAAYEYIKSFEKAGKGADGKPTPKIWE